jgi:hypothetical protein
MALHDDVDDFAEVAFVFRVEEVGRGGQFNLPDASQQLLRHHSYALLYLTAVLRLLSLHLENE